MDLTEFLEHRRPRWQKLADLLDRVDRTSLDQLPPEQAGELFRLYRLTSSDLNLVQTRTGDSAVVDYLEQLVARAYAVLNVPKPRRFLAGWWAILRHGFVATLRDNLALLALACAAALVGAVTGYTAVAVDPGNAELFLPPEHLIESPAERVADLEAMERRGHTRVDSAGDHSAFSAFLFTHNIRVSILCLALGLTLGIGTVLVLFYNFALLGAITYRYQADGELEFFIAWVGPHGSIELPCILFAGVAGLMLARAQLDRSKPFTRHLRTLRAPLVRVIVGAATLLVLAGVIEGGFSQVNEPTLPYPLKISVAAALFLGLLAYLFLLRVTPPDDEAAQHAARGLRVTPSPL